MFLFREGRRSGSRWCLASVRRFSLVLVLSCVIFICGCGRREGPVAGSENHVFRIVSTVATPGYAKDVYIEGGLAYVADSEGGLRVIDVTSPEAMRSSPGDREGSTGSMWRIPIASCA
ncbi:hypothetical protein AMJ82_07510 [candidate division TA06 bacterium SM23_40]|uniref:Uncharacterized protein n=1 Tax=candidate division TA06 bacterium SM23_40 TaxID=1703774 RepID=A0A0S8GAN2_UNCT6|nr:MAG: hypothetical protein AMJ82_07510 [candidate division TA06 bacterium SM23_40]